jgi:hypothetical protein
MSRLVGSARAENTRESRSSITVAPSLVNHVVE